MFSHVIILNAITITVDNPIGRFWYQRSKIYTKRSSGTALSIYVAHNTVLLIVHFWGNILEPEIIMD